jgi:DNA-binding CsgD family transcriptional regulator
MNQFENLSEREIDVVKLLLEGKSNKLIASALHISDRTVEFHLKNIYAKYQVNSRVELVVKLGTSTVASNGETAENRDKLNLRYWAASLRKTVSTLSKEIKMENVSNADNEGTTMTFQRAILVCLRKYADFRGRASRAEFWWFALFVTLVASALTYLNENLGSIFLIATLLPFLAVGTRRLRDGGKSGWWQLFLLVPVGGIVLLGFLWASPPASLLQDDTLAA